MVPLVMQPNVTPNQTSSSKRRERQRAERILPRCSPTDCRQDDRPSSSSSHGGDALCTSGASPAPRSRAGGPVKNEARNPRRLQAERCAGPKRAPSYSVLVFFATTSGCVVRKASLPECVSGSPLVDSVECPSLSRLSLPSLSLIGPRTLAAARLELRRTRTIQNNNVRANQFAKTLFSSRPEPRLRMRARVRLWQSPLYSNGGRTEFVDSASERRSFTFET